MKKILICAVCAPLSLTLALSGCSEGTSAATDSPGRVSSTAGNLPTVSSGKNPPLPITVPKPQSSQPLISLPLTSSPQTVGTALTDPPASPTLPATEPESAAYRLNPYLFYPAIEREGLYDDACRLVDAIADYESFVAIGDASRAAALADNIFYNYPPAALCSFRANADGIEIDYIYPEATHRTKIAGFAERVETILNGTLSRDWSDDRKAIELYRYVIQNVRYFSVDYSPADTSAYSAITRGLSICYGFADCYNYLLRQVGISAELLRGYRRGDRAAHGWSLICLDGQLYHCDPTWDASSGVRIEFNYFGMPDDVRFCTLDDDAVCGFGSLERGYVPGSADSRRYNPLWSEIFYLPWQWEKVEVLLGKL